MPAERNLLLADAGNSRVKWATVHGQAMVAGAPFASAPNSLKSTLARVWGDIPAPSEIWIANVAGKQVQDILEDWATERWEKPVHFAQATAHAIGVTNAYPAPHRLGVDRWLALLAAHHRAKGAACIADCGTAMTVDILDGEGIHRGGVIAPGLELMRAALAAGTDGVGRFEKPFRGVFGRETEAGVQGGTLLAAAGLIEKILAESADALGLSPRLILTGGDAANVAECLKVPHEIAPLLVLQGLWLIAGKNG